MSDDMFEDDPLSETASVEVPGTKEVPLNLVKEVEEAGFGLVKEMANYDRNNKEETMCDSLGRTTMQITPEGGGKFTTLTFVVPRTAEEKAQLKVDIELALRYGVKYGKKE